LPGRAFGGGGECGRVLLEEGLIETALEVLAGEASGERALERRVALAEREDKAVITASRSA
jgi:hypothetical protein